MISDILFEMVEDFDRYLNDPQYQAMYRGSLRQRIIGVRDDAKYIRFVLDTPYPDCHVPEGFVRERLVRQRIEDSEQAEKDAITDAS